MIEQTNYIIKSISVHSIIYSDLHEHVSECNHGLLQLLSHFLYKYRYALNFSET